MRHHSKAQVSIELTIALIACAVLLIGTTRCFVWMNKCIVDRQVAFQNTRRDPVRRIDLNYYQPNDNFYIQEKLDLVK